MSVARSRSADATRAHPPGDGPNVRRWKSTCASVPTAAGAADLHDTKIIGTVTHRGVTIRVATARTAAGVRVVQIESQTPDSHQQRVVIGPGSASVLERAIARAVVAIRAAERAEGA